MPRRSKQLHRADSSPFPGPERRPAQTNHSAAGGNQLGKSTNIKPASDGPKMAAIATILAAAIAVIGSITVEVLRSRAKPSGEEGMYKVWVKDEKTGEKIRNAKVSLEGRGVPAPMRTDSEGAFLFPNTIADKVLITVEVGGYERYELSVLPSSSNKIGDIRLTPIQAAPILSPAPTPTLTPSPRNLPVKRRSQTTPFTNSRTKVSRESKPSEADIQERIKRANEIFDSPPQSSPKP